jgi:hypothetical protein
MNLKNDSNATNTNPASEQEPKGIVESTEEEESREDNEEIDLPCFPTAHPPAST